MHIAGLMQPAENISTLFISTKILFSLTGHIIFPYKLDIDLLNAAASYIKHIRILLLFPSEIPRLIISNVKYRRVNGLASKTFIIYQCKSQSFFTRNGKRIGGHNVKSGYGKISIDEFCKIIERKDCTKADFSVPAHGLFFIKVQYKVSRLSHFDDFMVQFWKKPFYLDLVNFKDFRSCR